MKDLINAIAGIVTLILSSFIVAVLFAYIFRLPIPLSGYIGPFGEIGTIDKNIPEILKSVKIAWVFYGVFGGFYFMAMIGAVTGIIVGRKNSGSETKYISIVKWAFFMSFIPVFIISILDIIIGPW